jgi:transposase
MQYDAGIDVSLEQSSVCVVDAAGKIVKEAKIAPDPKVLVTFFKGLGFPVTRIGLEAGPLSQWLYAGLTQAGFDVVLLETRHVKAALSAMVVKTDRKDARGIAQLIRMGWFRAVHAKSASSQEIRALLTARRLLLDKLRDVELSLRGILRGFGLKLGKVTQRGFETSVRELVANHAMLQQITGSMLLARATLQREHNTLHKALLKLVRRDKVCRRFMTVPSVGRIVAITYKTAVDDPHRIKKSKAAPGEDVTLTWYELGEPLLIHTQPNAGGRRYGVCTILIPALGTRLSRNGVEAKDKAWPTEREGRPFSTSALAFSESWTDAR